MSVYGRALARELRLMEPQTAQEYNALCDAFDRTLYAHLCRAVDSVVETGARLLVSSKIPALKNRLNPKGGPDHL